VLAVRVEIAELVICVLDHKGCKPKCRFSQVINHGKSKVDPQGMIRHERIILTILQKRKINNKKKIGIFAFGFHSKVEQRKSKL